MNRYASNRAKCNPIGGQTYAAQSEVPILPPCNGPRQAAVLAELPQTVSRKKHRQRGIWHKRYWEHTVIDENDLKRCVDYVHWNPRKHDLAERVRDWKWSSFHRYVQAGEYDLDWGGCDPAPGWDDPEWGEIG